MTRIRRRTPLHTCLLLLAVLLSVDVAFVLVSVGQTLLFDIDNPALKVTRDGSYPELFQYAKAAVCAGLLAWLATRTTPRYAAWVALFGYLVLDDAVQVHERVGGWLVRTLDLPALPGLRPQDGGELLVTAVAGLVLGLAVLLAYRGADAWFRRASVHLAVLIALLAACGVGLDVVHQLVEGSDLLARFLGLLEDGGEMVVLSLALAYVSLLVLSGGRPPRLTRSRTATARR